MPSKEDFLAFFAQVLQLPANSEPMVIINKALTTIGVTSADLTPSNARVLDIVNNISTLIPGDQIMVREANQVTGHQAIFVGKVGGRISVVDMWGPDKASARIAVRPLKAFLTGKAQLLVFEYKSDSKEFRTLTKELALAFAAEADPKLLYNALSNNCEHFATLCRTFRYAIPTSCQAARCAFAVPSKNCQSFK
jgi:hypothetical protein